MRFVLIAVALALAACGAPSTTTASSNTQIAQGNETLAITDAWASPTPGGVTVSAGYMTITNRGASPDRLVGISTPRANSAEVHRMSMEGGMMQMRPAGPLNISAGGALTLAPGGLHLMFMGVAPPFAEGETIPVTLRFEHAGDVTVSLPVRRHSGH